MAIYAILLIEPSAKAWEKLRQHSFRYVLNPTSALVRPDDRATLASDIANSVGAGEEEDTANETGAPHPGARFDLTDSRNSIGQPAGS